MKHSINSKEEARIAVNYKFTYYWSIEDTSKGRSGSFDDLEKWLSFDLTHWKSWFEEGWKLYIIGGNNHDLIEYVKEVMEIE